MAKSATFFLSFVKLLKFFHETQSFLQDLFSNYSFLLFFPIIFRAIYHVYDEEKDEKKNTITDAAKDTSLLVRKLGKDIGLVIPPTGPSMRMTLNESLVKILVLTLIKPGERLLFTTFLQKSYEHFNIIIGPKEAQLHFEDISYLNDFSENERAFLELLRTCGFLRNLSDATSIVENPFKR